MACVPSLFLIAQSVCVKQATHISDVGDTPYHLVRPILKRLNAKQLAQLETNSPTLLPHSDELWGSLVERDFADRPCSPAKSRFSGSTENNRMPLRALYQKYALERDRFRATSADRLRKMTDKLRREKLKNSITTVQEVLADPTIRRRNTQYMSARNSYHKPRPTSILGRARRDVLQRLLMFGGANKPVDPYRPFQAVQKVERAILPNMSPPRFPNRMAGRVDSRNDRKMDTRMDIRTDNTVASYMPLQIITMSPPPKPRAQASEMRLETVLPDTKQSSSGPEPGTETAPIRKRKPAPSIFLNTRKRPPRPVPGKSPAGSGTSKPKSGKTENSETHASHTETRPIKPIKSSIFH